MGQDQPDTENAPFTMSSDKARYTYPYSECGKLHKHSVFRFKDVEHRLCKGDIQKVCRSRSFSAKPRTIPITSFYMNVIVHMIMKVSNCTVFRMFLTMLTEGENRSCGL